MSINKSISKLYSMGRGIIDENGAECILQLNSEVYFHTLYKALSDSEIGNLKDSYKGIIPEELLEFYKVTNGADIFSREIKITEKIKIYRPSISIYGIPDTSKLRTSRQPYDIRIEDLSRPKKCPDTWLFFASYFYKPMITLFFDTAVVEKGECPVYANIKDSLDIIKKWDSFDEWLSSEVTRMGSLFDSNGKFIAEEKMVVDFIK